MSKGFYDFDEEYAQTYTGCCEKCGRKILVSTQEDGHPEYYTNIFVKCPECGESIKFNLPVN